MVLTKNYVLTFSVSFIISLCYTSTRYGGLCHYKSTSEMNDNIVSQSCNNIKSKK